MVRKYARQRPSDDPMKKHEGHGMLISSDPEGQPVTTETTDPEAIYNHVQKGGSAFIEFKGFGFEDGYDIYDYNTKSWVLVMASAFTMSPDHVEDLTIGPTGILYFTGFFPEMMVSPGMLKGTVRVVTPAESEESGRGTLFGGTPPGRIVKVHMRIRPEVISYAKLIVGKALGTRPRIDWPKRD